MAPLAPAMAHAARGVPLSVRPEVLVVGVDDWTRQRLEEALTDRADTDGTSVDSEGLVMRDQIGDAATVVASPGGGVWVLGPTISHDEVTTLRAVWGRAGMPSPCVLMNGVDDTVRDELTAGCADTGPFFESVSALPVSSLAPLIAAACRALTSRQLTQLAEAGVAAGVAAHRRHVLTLADGLAEARDASDVIRELTGAVREALEVVHVRCWRDGDRGAVLVDEWLRAPDTVETARASAGLTVYALRTGQTIRCAGVVDDSRFRVEVDAPSSGCDAHVLAVPLPNVGAGQAGAGLAGVVVVERSSSTPPFSVDDQAALEAIVEAVAPFWAIHLGAVVRARRLESLAEAQVGNNLFREEALREHLRGADGRGRWLVPPRDHGRIVFVVLLGLAVLALLLATVVPIRECVSGPAVLRIGARTEVTTDIGGTVSRVLVTPATRVRAGAPLVHFYGASEVAEVTSLERAFEQLLHQRMQRPGDASTAPPLLAARSSLERARRRLELLTVRAPEAGVVSDSRIRSGEHLAAGSVLMTLVTDGGSRSVQAFLPGHVRPKLAVGQTVRLTVAGFPHARRELTVTDVGEGVIGPAEGRQVLGSALRDSVQFDGPLAWVSAAIEGDGFTSGGRVFQYFDGMHGTVEILVGSEPLLLHLFPALDAVWPIS